MPVESEAKDKPAAKPHEKFASTNGLEVTEKSGKYEFRMNGDSTGRVVFSTDASDKGLEEAQKKLDKLIDEKISYLEKTYSVSVAPSGEKTVQRWMEKSDCSWERGEWVYSRKPLLKELYGIESAIHKSQPSQLINAATPNGLRFYFLDKNYYNTGGAAYYSHSADKPKVFFDPGMTDSKPILESDSEKFGRNIQYSIEAVTIHELAHNAQSTMGWHDTAANYEKFASSIGWKSFEDPKSHETVWLLEGKGGELYRRGSDNCKDTKVWVQVDKDGNPLDSNGKATDSFKKAKTYTTGEIRNLARVRPPTTYFTNPLEMFAEGMMLFRLGERHRGDLLEKSPTLYEAVKKHDQGEVDKAYGVDSTGAPLYLRKPNGSLTSNSEELRKTVAEFEKKMKGK